MLLENVFVSKVSQLAASRNCSLLQVIHPAGRSLTGARPQSLRTWSKASTAEGFLRTLKEGSRGISYGGLVKAFQGQLLQRLMLHRFITGVVVYCQNSGMKNPVGWDFIPVMVWSTPLQVTKFLLREFRVSFHCLSVGKIRFGVTKVLLVVRRKSSFSWVHKFKITVPWPGQNLNWSCRLVEGWCSVPTLLLTSALCWRTLRWLPPSSPSFILNFCQ